MHRIVDEKRSMTRPFHRNQYDLSNRMCTVHQRDQKSFSNHSPFVHNLEYTQATVYENNATDDRDMTDVHHLEPHLSSQYLNNGLMMERKYMMIRYWQHVHLNQAK